MPSQHGALGYGRSGEAEVSFLKVITMNYPTVLINGIKVRVDNEGRYNLNDLHRSAVEGKKATESQRPGNFIKSAQVKRFAQELTEATFVASVKTIKGGVESGVWGLELIAIRYAAWIDLKFEIQVYNTFVEAKRQKASARMERNTARLEYRPMTDAIKHERETQGKDIKPYHFSNEADLINRIALGMTAAKFRVYHEIGKKENIRDYLTPEQIHCVTELQRANTVFIGMGWDFEQRKEALKGVFDRNHRQPLIEEQHRLAA